MNLPCLQSTPEGVILHIHLQPRSSRDQIVGLHNDALKIQLTAPPVDGKANKALIAFLAAQFGISKSSITLLAGDHSRQKRLLLKHLSLDAVSLKLADHLHASE